MQAWLEGTAPDEEEPSQEQEDVAPARAPTVDRYGVDLEVFKMKSTTGRRPWDFKKALKIAGWIHIDEIADGSMSESQRCFSDFLCRVVFAPRMRSLLELHYDDVHFQRWKGKDGKATHRHGEHMVFTAVALSHRKRLCSRLCLPKSVKDILQKPEHEDDWARLEHLRRAILLIVEGEDWLRLESPEEASAVACAVDGCTKRTFIDEVGKGRCRLPEGARVQLEGPNTKGEVLAELESMGNEGKEWLRFLSRPFGTQRAPLVDSFCRSLFCDSTAETIATEQGLSATEFLDRTLLSLWDALFLQKSEEWTRRGVSNMCSDEPYEVAKWFMRCSAGQAEIPMHPIWKDCSVFHQPGVSTWAASLCLMGYVPSAAVCCMEPRGSGARSPISMSVFRPTGMGRL